MDTKTMNCRAQSCDLPLKGCSPPGFSLYLWHSISESGPIRSVNSAAKARFGVCKVLDDPQSVLQRSSGTRFSVY